MVPGAACRAVVFLLGLLLRPEVETDHGPDQADHGGEHRPQDRRQHANGGLSGGARSLGIGEKPAVGREDCAPNGFNQDDRAENTPPERLGLISLRMTTWGLSAISGDGFGSVAPPCGAIGAAASILFVSDKPPP
jgi:hypothetical protein